MTMIQQALTFPFSDKFWVRRLLVGGILLPMPFIFFFPFGYLMRHFQTYLKGHRIEKLPEWDDLPTIFLFGFWASVIFLGYLVVPFLIFAMGVKLWGGYIGVFLVVLAFVFAVYFLSFYPMGLASYLMTGDVKAAFRKNEMYAKISQVSTSYYNTYLLAILLFFLGGNSPFVAFFLLIVLCELFGRALRPVFDTGEEEAAE